MLLNKKYKIFDVHNHIFPDNIAEKAVENIGRYYNRNMYESGLFPCFIYDEPLY
jgi:hypothetical protein